MTTALVCGCFAMCGILQVSGEHGAAVMAADAAAAAEHTQAGVSSSRKNTIKTAVEQVGSLLILVGVLCFVDDMLEGLSGLVQVDLCFINSRLQHTQLKSNSLSQAGLCSQKMLTLPRSNLLLKLPRKGLNLSDTEVNTCLRAPATLL